jgi:hypothetical protein
MLEILFHIMIWKEILGCATQTCVSVKTFSLAQGNKGHTINM